MQWILSCLFCCFSYIHACYIQGYDTGVCTEFNDYKDQLSFCDGNIVNYPACLPISPTLWPDHNPITKDRWVGEMYKKMVLYRETVEKNKTLSKSGVDEWGVPGDIVPRFTQNADCTNAYKNFLCWLNFPRCDATGKSLIMCRSVCENLFTACQQPKDLWRCGEPKYLDGYAAETGTVLLDGSIAYYRAPFPGTPFRDNAFDKTTHKPLPVCTPSLQNDSALVVVSRFYIIVVGVILLSLLR